MVTLEQMFSEKKEVSAQVSTQVRTAGVSFIAVSWALLTAHDDTLKKMSANVNHLAVLFLAAVGFSILACDLLQYVATVRFTDSAIRSAKNANPPEGLYDSDSWAYKANGLFFKSKFYLLVLGAATLVWIFVGLAQPLSL